MGIANSCSIGCIRILHKRDLVIFIIEACDEISHESVSQDGLVIHERHSHCTQRLIDIITIKHVTHWRYTEIQAS